MISRTLVRLIDQAIVPAIILLATRLASVILISYIYEIKLVLTNQGFVFENESHYLLVNSYSSLAMIIVLGVGLLYILLKAFIFHDTHVTPSLTTKLFHYKLTTLIQSSFELYSQGVIWLAYLYLISIVSGILAMFGLIYGWISVVGLLMSILGTVVLVFDVENEIELRRAEGEELEYDEPKARSKVGGPSFR